MTLKELAKPFKGRKGRLEAVHVITTDEPADGAAETVEIPPAAPEPAPPPPAPLPEPKPEPEPKPKPAPAPRVTRKPEPPPAPQAIPETNAVPNRRRG